MEKYKEWRRRVTVVVLGWASATLFLTALLIAGEPGGQRNLYFTLYINAVLCGLWTLSLPLLAKGVQRFPFSRENRLGHGAVLLLVVVGLANLVWFVWWAGLFWTWFPADSSHHTFASVLRSEVAIWSLRANLFVGIILVMGLQVRRIRQDFRAERVRASELERRLAESQLAALRMQLHPHFLFNTLHTIAGLISDEPTTARRMIVDLGDFLRLTLREEQRSMQSLAEELAFVDLYMSIEKLRLGDRLILNYEIEPAAASADVPHLLLQPLFENAVRHGAARLTGSCGITFHASRENGRLNLWLENDGPARPLLPDTPQRGVGLANTLARLSLHYGDDFDFEYVDRPQGGVRIALSLPWRKAGR